MRVWPILLVAACSQPSDESQRKQLATPPPGMVEIPAALAIEVAIDGAPAAQITAAQLKASKPDFADANRSAWLIPKLVPEATGSIEAFGSAGISVTYPHAMPGNMQPVLFLTRRGDVNVEAIDPTDPFPRFHGNGGRLHRIGDSLPHVEKVTRLAITRAK
jgi:hypothetical protein